MTVLAADVDTLLRSHGIEGVERPLRGGGYTAANLTAIEHEGQRYIVKRSRFAEDWLRQSTRDTMCREAEFAVSPVAAALPPGIATPTIGAAREGSDLVLLMRDISPYLVPETPLDAVTLDTILRSVAEMHAAFWNEPLTKAGVSWARIDDRLPLLSPGNGARLKARGIDFGVVAGWEEFDRRAPEEARALARRLFHRMEPLVRLIEGLPATLIHGDLKIANMALGEGKLWLLDWTGVSRAPALLDISWFLAVNSSLLPWPLSGVLDAYAAHLEHALGARRFAQARWPEQRGLAMVCGLLMYGWGKALDAAAGNADEFAWWCDGAVDAARSLSL